MESTPDNLPERLMWFHETTKNNPLMGVFAPLVEAAEEIKRLRKLAGDLADQWASCEAERNPQDFHEFGPCQLMQEGLALRTNK